jgi:hypothetical protein
MNRSRLSSLVAPVLLLGACEPGTGGPPGEGLRLVLVDSVVLQESGAASLGAPATLAAGSDGGVFVSDGTSGELLHFARGGELVRRIGRKGSGPGELQAPMATGVVGDSLVAVADWATGRTSLFDARSGLFRRSAAHEGLPFALTPSGDVLLLSGVNVRRGTSVALWPLRGDSMGHAGPIPAEYLSSPLMMEVHPYVSSAAVDRGILLGFTGHPDLFLTTPGGAVLDTVAVPRERRRGVPRDLVQRFASDPSNEEIAAMGSALVLLSRLPSGEVAATHLDLTLDGTDVSAEGYVTVLSADLEAACVDARIPLSGTGRPVFAFRGDTLLVLEQRLAAGDAESVLRSYRLDTAGCTWRPTAEAAGR